MKLFKAFVKLTTVVEIPVVAHTAEEALAYVNSTDEWKEDGGFGWNDEKKSYRVDGVELVTDPAQTTWPAESLCWGKEEIDETTVAEAFYGNPYPKIINEDEEGYNEVEDEKRWDAYFARETEIISKYDALRIKDGL